MTKHIIMSFFSKILGKKKKKTPSCTCKTCGTLLEFGEGHALTSAQIIQSKKYWDNVMLEPETKSYTIAHFHNNDPSATQMRNIIFLKSANFQDPWVICDTCVNMFEVNKTEVSGYAQEWWSSEKSFRPPMTGPAESNLEKDRFEEMKNYAVMTAGEDKI